jgi:hypothetical protein
MSTPEHEKPCHLVLEPSKEGLSYNRVIANIEADQEARLKSSSPNGLAASTSLSYVRAFDATPRTELARVAG